MDRRGFLKSAGIASLAAAATGLAPAGSQAAPKKHSNSKSARPAGQPPRQAVILMTDATRKDMLNCYKLTGLQTPNLDRIAAEGVRYERAYTTQPVCTAARSA